MIWIVLTVLLFLLMLLFPVLLGVYWYVHGKESVLPVRQEFKRDPRYFAKSFDTLFQKAWQGRKNGKLQMSRLESYLLWEEMDPAARQYPCDCLVVAQNTPFCPEEGVIFKREIYAFQDAHISCNSHIRAVYTRGRLILGKDVQLDRWADAEGTVAVYDGCDLGISVSAGEAVCVGKNCTFRRLYAPVVHLGAYPDQPLEPVYKRDRRIQRIERSKPKRITMHHISHSDTDSTGFAKGSYISEGKLIVDEDVVIQGDIKAHQGVHLAERALVCGNIFSDGDIHLGRNSTVLGNVFTQGDVYCEAGTVVGRHGSISSIIARGRIIVEENCLVYGYISNESGGIVCPGQPDVQVLHHEQYLNPPQIQTVLDFEKKEDFEALDSQDYRHNQHIRKVTVPQGVRKIPESIFFDCRELENLILPNSLEEIGAYAFADCKGLKKLDLSNLKYLRRIGRSAFDGCDALEEVIFPQGLEELGPAAFCNCSSLKQVKYPAGFRPTKVGGYCFHNCPLDNLMWLEKSQESRRGVQAGV